MSNVIWTKRNSWPLCDGPDVAGAFRPIKVVGEGAFGVVLLVRKVLGPGRGSTHAMKIMHKEAVDRRVLVAEREVLGKVCGIDSRFLVRLQYAFHGDAHDDHDGDEGQVREPAEPREPAVARP